MSRDLSQSVEAPKRYRLAEVPRSIPWADVQRMLDGVDRRTAWAGEIMPSSCCW